MTYPRYREFHQAEFQINGAEVLAIAHNAPLTTTLTYADEFAYFVGQSQLK